MKTLFIELKDITIRGDTIVAYSGMTIPQTMTTPEFFAISFWFDGGKEPIVATYENKEERDKDLAHVKKGIIECLKPNRDYE